MNQNQDHKMQDLGKVEPMHKTETLRNMEETQKIVRRRKIIIGIISFVLVVVLGGVGYAGYYYGTHRQSQTSATEEPKEEEKATYKNTRFGFQFSYPKSWQIDGEETSKKISILPAERPEGDKRAIELTAYVNSGLSSSSFIEKNVDANDYKGNSLEDISYTTKGSMIESYKDAYKTAFFTNEKSVAEISVMASEDDKDTYAVFEEVIKSFEFTTAEKVQEKTYTIQPGDTLFTISLKFNVDMDTLAQYNGIDDPNSIKYGMVIKIPSATQEANEKKFNIDLTLMKKYQTEADAGQGSGRLDPVAVAKEEAKGVFGINSSFEFSLVSIDKAKGETIVSAKSGDKKYMIYLTQPVKIGDGGIWTTSKITKES